MHGSWVVKRDTCVTPVMGLLATLPLFILPPPNQNRIVTLSSADKHGPEMRAQADNGRSLLWWLILFIQHPSVRDQWGGRDYWMVIKLSCPDFMNKSGVRKVSYSISFYIFSSLFLFPLLSVGDATKCGKRDCGELFKHRDDDVLTEQRILITTDVNFIFTPHIRVRRVLRKAWCYYDISVYSVLSWAQHNVINRVSETWGWQMGSLDTQHTCLPHVSHTALH